MCLVDGGRRQRAATARAGLEQLGVAALHLHRRQRLQPVRAEVPLQPDDRLLVAVRRGRPQRLLRRDEPVVEVRTELHRRRRHGHPTCCIADHLGQRRLGGPLGGEPLPQHLAALARVAVEASVDTKRPAAVLRKTDPRATSEHYVRRMPCAHSVHIEAIYLRSQQLRLSIVPAHSVPGAGFEPAWCCHQGGLSPPRLPVPPPGRRGNAGRSVAVDRASISRSTRSAYRGGGRCTRG